MNIFDELKLMQSRLDSGNWEQFETHYAELCRSHAPETAEQIAAVDLSYYNDRQFDAYCKALKRAKSSNAAAIYFEYNLDNDWQSSFFICGEYAEPEAGDDDWACDYSADVRGSAIPQFGEIYEDIGSFCATPEATAITLYLIARTTAALRSMAAKKPPGAIKLCIGFHDQDPLHRLSLPADGAA